MVAGAGEGHGKEHRPEAGKPVPIHIREHFHQLGGDDAVPVIQEQVARDQRHAGVDHGGHVTGPENIGTLDVKVLRQQHDGHAHHIDGDDEAHRKLQRVQDVLSHISGKEEPDNRQRIPGAVGLHGCKNACQRVEAGHQHKAKEQIQVQQEPDCLGDKIPSQTDRLVLHCASASSVGG